MIIQVDCAGNLGLVHALFRELGRADAVNTSTKDQQLVAHLDTPDWPMIDDNNISRAHCLTEESCIGYLEHPFNKNLLSRSETDGIIISDKALTSCLRKRIASRKICLWALHKTTDTRSIFHLCNKITSSLMLLCTTHGS
jgi:hypothetical protein